MIKLNDLMSFLDSKFSHQYPPSDPFLDDSWLGAAFDRNLYEKLAPDEWWIALLNCSSRILGESFVYLLRKSKKSDRTAAGLVVLPNKLSDIDNYLSEDARFTRDYYVVGENLKWAALLDQDVSVFGGKDDFIKKTIELYGGKNSVLNKMKSDFLGEMISHSESARVYRKNFDSYFSRLLRL